MLMRMASYHRLTDMESEFGIYYDEIDRVFLTMLEMVVEANYERMYNNVDYFVPRFEMYNHAIRNKILNNAEFNEMEIPLFQSAHDTALFCDGTRWEEEPRDRVRPDRRPKGIDFSLRERERLGHLGDESVESAIGRCVQGFDGGGRKCITFWRSIRES